MTRFTKTAFTALLSLLSALVSAQAGPNELAKYNPAKRTMSVNETWCIVPIDTAKVKALTGYNPLPVPSDPTIFPGGFPAGKHPMIVFAGYENDIRMTPLNTVPLQIASLMQGAIIIPYSDVTKDGKTPIGVPVNYYIGGTNGQALQAIVPSIASAVSPFEGTTIFPATFAPDTIAAQPLGGGAYSIEVKTYILPNTISGPGVYAEAFDIEFVLTQTSPYTDHTFHSILNQPQLLNNGKCQRNAVYFNFTDADPKMAVANVTLYHEILDSPPAAIEGTYEGVYCYQANGQLVGEVGESCAVAASKVDPKALQ